MPHFTLDKSHTWWGSGPDRVAHCYTTSGHALCDSHDGEKSNPVIDQSTRPVCPRCLMILNTAVQDSRGAHLGGG